MRKLQQRVSIWFLKNVLNQENFQRTGKQLKSKYLQKQRFKERLLKLQTNFTSKPTKQSRWTLISANKSNVTLSNMISKMSINGVFVNSDRQNIFFYTSPKHGETETK